MHLDLGFTELGEGRKDFLSNFFLTYFFDRSGGACSCFQAKFFPMNWFLFRYLSLLAKFCGMVIV